MENNISDLEELAVRSLSTNRHYGIFSIPRRMIEDNPEDVLRAMGSMIVLKAIYDWRADAFKYVALSSLFDEVGEDVGLPEYLIKFDSETIRAERLDPVDELKGW